MKKRGLYISLDHHIDENALIQTNSSNGIIKKICNQIKCFQGAGFEITVFCPYKNRNPRLHSIIRRLPFSGLIPYGSNFVVNANEYDFIYLRSPWFMNSDTASFMRRMKAKNKRLKIIVEVPTYDPSWGRGEINHWHMWPLYWKNIRSIKMASKYIDRVMTFSKDKHIYGVPTICTSNAIDPMTITPVSHIEGTTNTIQLIACSSMAFWHGYDRALLGLKNYYQGTGRRYDIYFHVVGDGEEIKNYLALIKEYDLIDHVTLYGYKSGNELNQLYNISDIAIDSLGRHRSKVYYNSSLKGKEYLAKGLPVISGVENELDSDPSFKYYLRIPADDSPLDMNSVVDFYEKVYLNGDARDDIICAISNYAKSHFSYEVALKPVVEYINSAQ